MFTNASQQSLEYRVYLLELLGQLIILWWEESASP